ncbi:MAG: hypothetical protein ACYTFG_00385 [Planctomycetota bacterium]
MKRLVILCLVPLMAGCFAWDLDEKPVPWMADPGKEKPSIGRVVYYPSGNQARVAPVPAVQNLGPSSPAPQRQPRVYEEAPAQPPAQPPVVLEPEPQPLDDRAAPASDGDPNLEKRLSNLESRLEELYQLILKSYEKRK